MTHFKKLLLLSMASLILFQAGGVFGFLYGHFVYTQANAVERSATLIFSPDVFSKIKVGDSEILFEGSMYDLEEVEIQDGLVKVRAFKDWSETELVDLAVGMFSRNESGTAPSQFDFSKILSLVYLPPVLGLIFPAFQKFNSFLPQISTSLSAGEHFIFSPPPERHSFFMD